MYTRRITHYPALGKGPELRAALEENAKALNAAGLPHNVTQQLYAKEPTFVTSIRHESLAEMEAYGSRTAADAAHSARMAKIGACIDRPLATELYENLITTARTGDVNYALRISYFPASGNDAELREAVEARAKTTGPGSVGKGLSTQVLAPDGAHYVLTVLFSSLGGLETYLKARVGNPAVQALTAQLNTLLSRSPRQEFYRILVPFPT